MRSYAGIGSRKRPQYARWLAINAAKELYHRGFQLRSGHATGMDQDFEEGHDDAVAESNGDPNKEIWLPEPGFEGSDSPLFNISPEAYLIAKRIHPNWKACNKFARNAHARNAHQILGSDLNSPVNAVLCYTDNAEFVGGTRTALILATEFNIPIFNFGDTSKSTDDLINFIDRVS